MPPPRAFSSQQLTQRRPRWCSIGSADQRCRIPRAKTFFSRRTSRKCLRRALFATRIKWMEIQALAQHYAATPDGQRFLISSATGEARSVPVTIVLSWAAAVKK